MIGARPVVVAASTHPGEEALIARATAGFGDDLLTVIVPRHPERGDEIVRHCRRWPLARRSAGEPIDAGDADLPRRHPGRDGPVPAARRRRHRWAAAFRGRASGHNPLEPARLGVGAISGPEVANFADIYAEMAAAGAAVIAPDEAALAATIAELLADRPRIAAMGQAALAFAQAQGDQLGRGDGADPAAAAGGMRLATPRWWYVRDGAPRAADPGAAAAGRVGLDLGDRVAASPARGRSIPACR